MEVEKKKLPPPPKLIATLAAGFDVTASHVLIVIPPLFLDLFLWLGPHLRLKQLITSLVTQLSVLTDQAPTGLQNTAQVQEFWINLLEKFNLFGILRTFPVGITSLMSGRMPIETPFGIAVGYELTSVLNILGFGLLLMVLGWVFGCLYFYWVSGVALELGPTNRVLAHSLPQTMLLSIIWITVLFVVGVPLLLFLGVLAVISPLLAQAAMLFLAFFSLWVVIPVYFSPHGIFIYRQNAFTAILSSLRMTRFTLPSSGLFMLSVILISQGLDFLWRIPPENSWWTLLGIVGHAFISTALLAAGFIYYRDINTWLHVVFEQLKSQNISTRI